MLITRIHRINEHFRARLSEWLLAGILFSWGWVLLLPYKTFDLPSMKGLAAIGSETQWGLGCLLIGAARLAVLLINGAWKRNAHGRMICAVVSCFAWSNITIGLFKGDFIAPGLAVYPMLLAVDFYIIIVAAAEARMTDEGMRRGKS